MKLLKLILLLGLASMPALATVRNVKTTCGAVGNNVADDTAAINACIGQLVSGDTLLFPAGTYKTSSQLTINVSNVTIDGSSNTATIDSVGGNATMRLGTESLGSAIALSATATELATSFTTVSSLGVVAGNYVYIKQGGQDSSTGSGNTGCDPAGCRGEVVKVLSVSGNTVTVTTALHDTYNPSVNAATAQKVNTVMTGVTMQNITLDGSSVNTHGLETRGVFESIFSGVTIRNILGSAVDTELGFNNSWSTIAITQAGSAQCGGAFFMERQGSPTITGMTLSNLNTAASACLANGSFGLSLGGALANGTFSNITVDKTGSGAGRPAKIDAVRWSTFNNLTVTGGSNAYNGLSVEYYSSHNTFNSCVITNNAGGAGSGNAGINSFGNFNQFNTFNGCTITGNGNVQVLINNFDFLRLGADSNVTIQNSTIAGPGQGILLMAANACINNNVFTAGSGLSPAISVNGSNNVGLGNALNGFTSNLTAGTCGVLQYYVSPSGAGTGLTVASPSNFASIQGIISGTLPLGGAVVNALPGSYGSGILWTKDAPDATHPIVVQSTTNFAAKIFNSATVAVQIGQSNNPATFITWGTIGHGFEITTNGPLTTAQCGGIYLWGQNSTIQGNWIHDITAPGTISGGPCGGGIGGAGIALPQGGTTVANDINHNNIVDANIMDNIGNGANVGCNNQHGIYLGSPFHKVTNNIVTRACGQGIEMYHATTGEDIENNVLYLNDLGGIQVVADSGVTCNNNTVVANNIVGSNGGRLGAFSAGGIGEMGAGCAGSSNRYFNNIVNNNSGGDFIFTQGPCTLATCGSGNITATTAQWNALFNSINANAALGDFHVTAGSIAVGAGSTACAPGGFSPCAPANDLAGTVRTNPTTIGAYNFGAGGGGGTLIVQVTPSPFAFPDTVVGGTSNQLFTVQNIGTLNLTITQVFTVSPTTNFATGGLGGTCFVGQILAPTTTCTASAHFTPTTTGALSASYNFFTNATAGTYVVSLTGNGLPATAPDAALIPLFLSDLDEVALDQGITPCPETPPTPTCTAGTKCWKWVHDTGTSGTSCGNSAIGSSPSLDGFSREFDISWTGSGGERFSILTNPSGLDTSSKAFVYDTTVYVNSLTLVNQLEFDYNQVIANGDTVILGTQCNLASGFVDYSSKLAGVAHWNPSTIPCTRAQWNLSPTPNRLIITYHRDASGNVTYDSWDLNGVTTLFSNATVPAAFSLGWTPIGGQVLNFQINGSSTTSSTSAFLEQTSIYAQAATLNFPNTSVNSTSASLQVVVLNNGSAPLSITNLATSGRFLLVSDNCPRSPSTLAVQASCRANVAFIPNAPGVVTGSLTLTSNASSGASQVANLAGTSIQSNGHVTGSSSLSFPDTFVGASSPSQVVTIANTGTGPMLNIGISLTGDFSKTTTCGTTLAVGNSCTITLIFSPTQAGSRTGVLTVSSSDGGPVITVNLGGTGVIATNGVRITGGVQITGGVKVLN